MCWSFRDLTKLLLVWIQLLSMFVWIALTARSATPFGAGRKPGSRYTRGLDSSPPAARRDTGGQNHTRPHIVFVLADDLGYTDVGWNNDYLPPEHRPLRDITPTLTRLANEGVILDQAFSTHLCSPSRAALLTGRYPFRYGFVEDNLHPDTPFGLGLTERLLPQALLEFGYKTHVVGKWHLGHCNSSYLPTSRGFQSFFGHLVGSMDYFDHTYSWRVGRRTLTGLALHNGTEPVRGTAGTHSSYLFADVAQDIINTHERQEPLFLYLPFTAPHAIPDAPQDIIRYVKTSVLPNASPSQQLHAAVIITLDRAVRQVVEALRERDMWENTILVFTSDNGPNPQFGSSFPLRGKKGTVFDGGVRVPTFIAGAPRLFLRRGVREKFLVHITDWYPTLLHLACACVNREQQLDGRNFAWKLFVGLEKTNDLRSDVLYTIRGKRSRDGNAHACSVKIGAYRHGNMKLIMAGRKKLMRDGWYYGNINAIESSVPPWLRRFPSAMKLLYTAKLINRDHKKVGLFDLDADPYEQLNVIKYYPDIANQLTSRLLEYCNELTRTASDQPHLAATTVTAAYPKTSSDFWTHGWC